MTLLTLMLSCAPASGAPLPPGAPPPGFWDHWGDGRAELAGYRLVQPRYGAQRPGQVVLVTVTETFTEAGRVKSDGGHDDEYPVLKVNEARDFQTGVYDYNTQSSIFVALDGRDAAGVPTKLSFSSQEWCGNTYDELIVDGPAYRRAIRSYFDGESADDLTLAIPADGVFVDALPVLVRGLTGEVLEPGGERSVQLHPRLIDLRFAHRPASWTRATWTVDAETTRTTVPAGTFETRMHRFTAGSEVRTYTVEVAAPHRLIAWTAPGGERAELTGSVRQAYWTRNRPGDLEARAPLGLPVPAWTTLPPAR
jgi:hypothetical protein